MAAVIEAAIAKAIAFDECKVCAKQLALVDSKVTENGPKGGSWVHLSLPESVHVGVPKGNAA